MKDSERESDDELDSFADQIDQDIKGKSMRESR